uniref:M23 family metallopeptidase n=1 Tax=Altererythrobacter segetis TaxID=1104773 RepID=UPI0014074413|nr:M23 family metallopeptidase [Altererythrobacter segetis]
MSRWRVAAAGLLALASCAAPATEAPPPERAQVPATGSNTFVYSGEATQGGWIRGQAPAGTVSARLDDQPLVIDGGGRFFAAFDRDARPSATLVARLRDERTVESPLTITPRAWDIEHVDVARTQGKTDEEFLAIRKPELARIAAARAISSPSDGWRQTFIWPAKGRISGRFGSQRIYKGGEAGSYHSGIDIAPGAGAPIVAPADGVVVLAAEQPFSLEGHLLMIDHGAGLNSAFLHCDTLAVKVGDHVRQGQLIATVGMTGRATGPHLHWSLTWRGARLDPLLFAGPMG